MQRTPTHRPHRRTRERGIALPIAAILAGVLVTAILTLGVNTVFIKLAQRRLRSGVDWACRRVLPYAVMQRHAFEKFDSRMYELSESVDLLRSTKIVNAKLIIPTMPASGDMSPGSAPFTPSYTPPTPGCTAAGINCTFEHDITAQPYFPQYSVDNLTNAGNAVGCEVEADLSPIFGPARRATIRVLWWIPVRGVLKPRGWTTASATFTPTALSRRTGLTIGIATEAQIDPLDHRFLFYDGGVGYPSQFSDDYDPLARFNAGMRRFYSGSAATVPDAGASDSIAVPALSENLRADAKTNSTGGTVPRSPAAAVQPLPGIPGSIYVPSDQEMMLMGCMNPMVLARNTFLSIITELASRHGQLRDSTEVVHINPEGAAPSPPTRIAAFGEDIARSLYQIPFVFFKDSSSGAWNDPTSGTVNQQQYRTMLASQLRYCYHLYSPEASGAPSTRGIQRFQGLDLTDTLRNFDADDPSQSFEPVSTGYPRYFTFPSPGTPYFLYPGPFTPAGPQRWDQDSAAGTQQGLTIGELVSTLGLTQRCPSSHQTGGQPLCAPGPISPDLLSFFRYVARTPQSFAGSAYPGATNGFPSTQSPGLFRLINPGAELPFNTGRYLAAENTGSHILLVLHDLHGSQAPAIRSIVTSLSENPSSPLRSLSRALTIAFFPWSYAQVDTSNGASALSLLLKSIYSDPPPANPAAYSSTAVPTMIKLLVFSPYFPKLPASPPAQERAEMQAYWATLLTDGENNIANIAYTTFHDRILRAE